MNDLGVSTDFRLVFLGYPDRLSIGVVGDLSHVVMLAHCAKNVKEEKNGVQNREILNYGNRGTISLHGEGQAPAIREYTGMRGLKPRIRGATLRSGSGEPELRSTGTAWYARFETAPTESHTVLRDASSRWHLRSFRTYMSIEKGTPHSARSFRTLIKNTRHLKGY